MYDKKKHIVLIVPRGEAVRNFLYSDTIKVLKVHARVTVLCVIDDPDFVDRFKPYTDRFIRLKEIADSPKSLKWLQSVIHDAHFKWLKSAAAVNYFEVNEKRARERRMLLKFRLQNLLISPFANNKILQWLTVLENNLIWKNRKDSEFEQLFKDLKPDLIFNTSHIHGPAGELAAKIGRKMGIRVAGFIFSWDNLFSRSRMTVRYNDYLVWTPKIKNDLLRIYPFIKAKDIYITGTPQFDYHFKHEFVIPKEDLAKMIGFDPNRPYVFYSTGIDRHVQQEHLHIQSVIDILTEMPSRPQLIVRTYAKGTSAETYAIRDRNIPGVYFPKVEWDEVMYTPSYNDLSVLSSLLRYAALGINVASTLMLELFMFKKPAINIAYNPPGSNLEYEMRHSRFLDFEHFVPVIESGATETVHSVAELKKAIMEAFQNPDKHLKEQETFLKEMFGSTLDGKSGERVAEVLLKLAGEEI